LGGDVRKWAGVPAAELRPKIEVFAEALDQLGQLEIPTLAAVQGGCVGAWTGLIFGLGLCGTGLAYVIYYYIVENLGAVAAAGVTYIPPVVALVIGVFLAGDVIHPLGYLAMVLILSGVALLQYGSRRASVSKG
jgi:drug/metabolite transporter (DMT)-like permease